MIVTDPIADMLTRIRNALVAKHEQVQIPSSNAKKSIAAILKKEGFINDYEVVEQPVQDKIVVTLKYGPNYQKVINGLKRISKPGVRVYARVDQLPRVLNGMGIAIISTPKGIMTCKEARVQHVGGEVLAYVW